LRAASSVWRIAPREGQDRPEPLAPGRLPIEGLPERADRDVEPEPPQAVLLARGSGEHAVIECANEVHELADHEGGPVARP
jgi:hypothetical protein